MPGVKKLKRKNFVFPAELADWVEKYAAKHNTTVTRIIVDHLVELRKQVEAGHVDQV